MHDVAAEVAQAAVHLVRRRIEVGREEAPDESAQWFVFVCVSVM